MIDIVDKRLWKINKRRILRRLAREIKKKRVDEDVIPLLEVINSIPDFVTLSSCYGRIVILETDDIGDKVGSKFLAVWHNPVTISKIVKLLSKYYGEKTIWLQIQSTILHVSTYNLIKALHFRNLAIEAGYKYSKILSISKRGITIEILGTERLDIPIKRGRYTIVNLNELKTVEKYIFKMFERIEKRKNKFIYLLKNRKI